MLNSNIQIVFDMTYPYGNNKGGRTCHHERREMSADVNALCTGLGFTQSETDGRYWIKPWTDELQRIYNKYLAAGGQRGQAARFPCAKNPP